MAKEQGELNRKKVELEFENETQAALFFNIWHQQYRGSYSIAEKVLTMCNAENVEITEFDEKEGVIGNYKIKIK